jgi:hypothetical protein
MLKVEIVDDVAQKCERFSTLVRNVKDYQLCDFPKSVKIIDLFELNWYFVFLN